MTKKTKSRLKRVVKYPDEKSLNIDGKKYKFVGRTKNKRDAKREAKKLREDGNLARVATRRSFHYVYSRKK